jgi:cell wall-associated NlpC family hydrolase
MFCLMMDQLLSRILLQFISRLNLKKIIMMIAMLAWMSHSCFAATTHHTASANKPGTHKQTRTLAHTKQKKAKSKAGKLSRQKKTSHRKSTTKKPKKNQRRTVNSTPITTTENPRAKINVDNIEQAHLPGYLLTSIERNLVDFVRKTVATIRYTAYKLGGTRIDDSRGIYVVDCSTYVDHILKTVYPNAYTSLTSWTGSEKPTSDDFYHYFINLSGESRHWNTIDDVEKLRPGDVLVFRYKNRSGNETGGHVMVVMDKPVRDGNTFMVRIADSAPSRHSEDTRTRHTSGIGIGTMLLKVNPKTFQPYAYAWKVGSRWESNVNFAMARPIDVS